MTVVAKQPLMHELVAPDAQLEHVAGDFGFLEGPVWRDDGCLLFTDVRRDAIHRLDADGVREHVAPANIPNGMSLDLEGRLLVCEQSTSALARYSRDGTREVVASHYRGLELNSPNDVVCRSDGSIYFTDPPAGRSEPHGRPRESERELDFQGVFVIPADSDEVRLLFDGLVLPNGLCFSPDESRLYVNDTMLMQIVVCDVRPDGSVGPPRLFFQMPGDPPDPVALGRDMREQGSPSRGLPDGMKVDARGNVYCGGPGGVWVIGPDGAHIGVIETPAFVGNLAWGDADWRSLYLCVSKDLFRLRMLVEGAPPAFPKQ